MEGDGLVFWNETVFFRALFHAHLRMVPETGILCICSRLKHDPNHMSIRKRILQILSLGLLAVPFCCGQSIGWKGVLMMVRQKFPDVKYIQTAELASMLSKPSTLPLILDARKPEEFAISHLKNAKQINPDATSFPALQNVPQNQSIVVYCSVGYRSAQVAKRLQEAGFTHVQNLEGSIFKWANEGRAVYREDRLVQDVHPFDDQWGLLLKSVYRTYQPRN